MTKTNVAVMVTSAIVSGVVVAWGDVLGLQLGSAAFVSVLAGILVATVPNGPVTNRIIGFLLGVLFAWISYALRAAVLPDSDLGRGIAATLIVLGVAVVAIVAGSKVPWWAMITGLIALTSVYEATYNNAPSRFLDESPIALTSVLVASGIAIFVVTLVSMFTSSSSERNSSANQEVSA